MPIRLLSSAVKRIAALISTSAALVVLLVNAKNLGLDAWLGAHGLSFANAAVRRVVVAPRADTVYAIGDTIPLAATVTDKRGATVAGASLIWKSNDTTVAQVDSGGTVVSRGPGTAVITVAVRDILATARVTVAQRVTCVAVSGDSVRAAYDGDTLRLVAHPVDARGHPALDRVVWWESDKPAVVSVDSAGDAHALEPGRATLVASWEEFRDTVTIDVALGPATLELVSQDGQRAPAGSPLPDPVVVRVLSRDGRPVPQAAVAFLPPRDSRGEPDTAMTDDDGRARTIWTLSPRPGRQRLFARVATLDSPVVVTAEAEPVPENTRVEYLGTALVGRAGELLAEPLAVQVTDSLGRVLDDLPIAWTAREGGTVEALGERTDSLGTAAARWTLGPAAGSQRLVIQVGNPRTVPPLTLTATARPGPPAVLALLSGDRQRGMAGQPLAQAIIARVSDAMDNPVAGVAVSVRPSHGSVPDSTLVSDSTGRVSLNWTPDSEPGAQFLELRAAGVDSVVRVTARVRAPAKRPAGGSR